MHLAVRDLLCHTNKVWRPPVPNEQQHRLPVIRKVPGNTKPSTPSSSHRETVYSPRDPGTTFPCTADPCPAVYLCTDVKEANGDCEFDLFYLAEEQVSQCVVYCPEGDYSGARRVYAPDSDVVARYG